ncbi:MAG: YfdQ family protein [Candidatus Omnitrophica bacterium]|nr:YfdQ family protein [Candidatus Omnitrophota bacterium]MBU1785282.1 YfdQ family protein [Candidatus Omnitrophota bacterium]MBU1852379.1 YfdQ family protein [Candidatus Omnitrophota bacterium]
MALVFDKEVTAAVQAGTEAAHVESRIYTIEGVPVVLLNQGQSLSVPADVMKCIVASKPGPRRRVGTSAHQDLGSFIEHVNRFKSEHTTLWALLDEPTITAVYDYHPAGPDTNATQWCAHKAIYSCPLANEWTTWTQGSGRSMAQEAFAEFVEDHLEDLTSGEGFPDPMAILEMSRDLKVHTKGRFERKFNKTTGEYHLVCSQENESSSTAIPRAFLLAIPIFKGGELYKVEARMRLSIHDGAAYLVYKLHRSDELLRAAFKDVMDVVAEKTGVPLFVGSPE